MLLTLNSSQKNFILNWHQIFINLMLIWWQSAVSVKKRFPQYISNTSLLLFFCLNGASIEMQKYLVGHLPKILRNVFSKSKEIMNMILLISRNLSNKNSMNHKVKPSLWQCYWKRKKRKRKDSTKGDNLLIIINMNYNLRIRTYYLVIKIYFCL